MNKDENKGLADSQEGEFVLNESGTFVSIDADIDFSEDKEPSTSDDKGERYQALPRKSTKE
ncbi:MAG: hypothetical protein M3040_16550 [Bacteroidota bacterium]|nr:hypothetical protein [Bacteroidota bacterium]